MAGPADASQSVLKNNRSSLKGDFTESAELYLVLHDLSGHPINVSEGLEFVQSGTNVPYVQVSAIDYSKNFSGEYKATVTGGGEGIATLIPVLNGVHQAGLNTTIEFISAEARPMTGTVSVNGATLPAASFPSQGFTGAYYQLNNDNFAPGKTAADYTFSSTASWVGVDATGKVTFKNDGDSNTVEITATPRSGGAIYQTQVRVKGWWKDNNNIILPLSRAENYCNNEIGNDMVVCVQQPMFTEMFGASYRYSGAGVGYQVASVVGGGFTPFIAAALITYFAGNWHSVAIYLLAGCLISAMTALLMKDSQRA